VQVIDDRDRADLVVRVHGTASQDDRGARDHDELSLPTSTIAHDHIFASPAMSSMRIATPHPARLDRRRHHSESADTTAFDLPDRVSLIAGSVGVCRARTIEWLPRLLVAHWTPTGRTSPQRRSVRIVVSALRHAAISLVAVGVALTLSACGQAFTELGLVTRVNGADVCVSFANGRTTCIPMGRVETTAARSLVLVDDCLKVRFAGESARVLSAAVAGCAPESAVPVRPTSAT
jgi:hypothetical protein